MKKTILDLTTKELNERAGKASRKAVEELLKKGIYTKTEDGRVELKQRKKNN